MRVWVLLLLLVQALAAAQDRGATQHFGGSGSVRLRKATVGELLLEESKPCLTFRDHEDQLLCNRSRFNLNPFGLRFGRRVQVHREAVKLARRPTLGPTAPEVPA